MPAGRVERWALGVQAALVLGSLMAIGTVHVPVLITVACVALVLPVLVLSAGLETPKARLFAAPVIVLGLLSAYSLAQALPMPMAWLKVLSPGAADIWSRALLPFGEPGPAFASLSADPGASLREALKWMVYAAVFGSAAVLAARRGLRWAVVLVFGAAVLAALTTIAHGLLGAHRVFGVYQPEYAHLRWSIGPLLNPNNLAGYLNLGAICGFGLMFDRGHSMPLSLIAFGISVLVGTSVVCASRAGVVALPAGMLVFWLLTRRNSRVRRSETARRLWWISVAAVLGGVVLAIFGSSRATWDELLDRSLQKFSMVAWTIPLAKKFPWFGIGRGASESVFAAFRQAPGHTVFTQIENFAAEWVAEWGLPVAVLALVTLGWHLRPARLGTRQNVLAAGAVAAASTLLGQNFFDLGLEIPAVCIALATLLGASWGASRVDADTSAVPVQSSKPWIAAAAPLAIIVLFGTCLWGRRTDLADREHLYETYARVRASDTAATSTFRAMLRQAVLRHPAEPYFPLLGGLVAWSSNQDALPWLTRSLERDPMNGRTHFAAAFVVRSRGQLPQALLELRYAANADSRLERVLGRTAVGWTHDRDQLASTLPEDNTDAGNMLTSMAAALTSPADANLRTMLLQDASQRDPANVDARVQWTRDLIHAIRAGASSVSCRDREKCLALVREQINSIASLDADGSNAPVLSAEVLMAVGRATEANRLLMEQCPKLKDHGACGRVWLVAAARTGDTKGVSDSIDTLTTGCISAARCALAYNYAGDVLMRNGLAALALTNYERAAVSDSTSQRWRKVADAASQSGAHFVALEALQRVRDSGGATPDIERRIAEERHQITATVAGVDGAE